MLKFRGFYYAPDEKGGTGSGEGGNTDSNAGGGGSGSSGTAGASDSSNASGNGGSSTGSGNGSANADGSSDSSSGSDAPGKVVFTPEQQAALNSLMAKETAKAEARGKKAAQTEAETAKAKEEGRFKDLHDAQEKRIKEELEPAAERANVLSVRVNASIDAEIKDWPESVRKTDPGKDEVLKRIEWADSMRDLAKDVAKLKEAPDGEHGGGSRTTATGIQKPTEILSHKYRTPGAAKK